MNPMSIRQENLVWVGKGSMSVDLASIMQRDMIWVG